MHRPAFSSEHYRRLGWKPVYWCGLVLWLTPFQYQKARVLCEGGEIVDATEAQIEAQDRWHERALSEEEREWSEFGRLFGMTR